MKRPSVYVLVLLLAGLSFAQTQDFTRWVNPFIGTGGHGHTFPGAVMPFGMVQLSPDTREANWDGSSGYHYSDDIIYGFSHTHLSGTGIPDGCDILFMPTINSAKDFSPQIKLDPNKPGFQVKGFASTFSHPDEKAEPGYYSVKLDDGKLLAELTTTKRVGFHRYTFPASKSAGIDLDLIWRDKVIDRDVKVVSDKRIEGYRRSSSWAKDQVVYFVAEFSKPFKGWGSGRPSALNDDKDDGLFFGFDTKDGEQVLLKVAISSVSIEGARKNLAAELPGWDFDKVRADAKAAWNKELSKIEVSGGTDAQTTTFYTALYHTMIHPSLFNDVDGSYRGLDGKAHNIHTDGIGTGPQADSNRKSSIANRQSDNYTVFSLWDTFRAAHPLYTIIEQKRTVDFINTFIRQYEQGGRLPVWELWGNETDCMIGYHAVPVIADSMAKGIKGFDYEKAYEAAKHSAELDRDGLASYKRRGYISMEDDDASVSKTLEYAYDDWCIAKMAEIMGKRYEDWLLHTNKALQSDLPERQYAADYQKYVTRARSFENLFDASTGFMRPKKNGGFISPFAANEVTFNYTEGNAWVYSFFVPQDITRLIELEGGPANYASKLDALFSTTDKLTGRDQPDITGLIGQYAHGNEPSHHIGYLYDYAGEPWTTQKYVRKIMDEFYKPSPDGLIGNEDCGQMSAWYVLSASGFYEVTPGSAIYAFGTPLFKEIKYNLENGKTFTIKAPIVSATNFYIKSASLNGQAYRKAFISHEELMGGGTLEFEMADHPFRMAFTEFPVSSIKAASTAVPLINFDHGYVEATDGEDHIFKGVTEVSITSINPNSKIYYTTDGSIPSGTSTLYKSPFTIDNSPTIKAIAVNPSGTVSNVVEAKIHKKPNNWTVSIASKYNRQYTGGGDEGLIDGIRGTTNFASGEWQGYHGKDFVATVDLQKPTQILMLGAGFLQNVRSWIWMPTHIEFEYSRDGVEFSKIADIKTDVSPDDMEPRIRDYKTPIKPVDARYLRIHAYNFGKIPSWHPGAGGDPWIFVDEILINQ